MDNTYNGWANRETWLINLWYNPESVDDIAVIKEDFENKVEELPGVLKDMINTNAIDWDELAQTQDDYEEDNE